MYSKGRNYGNQDGLLLRSTQRPFQETLLGKEYAKIDV